METGTKENILAFNRGVSNTPSDLVCDDDCLADCYGLVNIDGELKAVQELGAMTLPTELGRLMYVHRLNSGGVHHVFADRNTLNIEGVETPIDVGSEIMQVDSIGNTLIVNAKDGIHYYLWDASVPEYKSLGNGLPEVEMEFSMGRNQAGPVSTPDVSTDGSAEGIDIEWGTSTGVYCEVKNDILDYENLIGGLYNKTLSDIEKQNKFCFPFFVMYALELSDGSYIKASNPVLMTPCCNTGMILDYNGNTKKMTLKAFCSELLYKLKTTISKDWNDIVKGVTVFASRQISFFDTEANIYTNERTDSRGDKFYTMPVNNDNSIIHSGIYRLRSNRDTAWDGHDNAFYRIEGTHVLPYKRKGNADIKREIENTSVFYKIFDVGVEANEDDRWLSSHDKMENHVLENLETQSRLDDIDYYSHCGIHAKNIYTFNRRLNVIGAERGFFNGFKQFEPQETSLQQAVSTERTYTTKVYIKTQSGIKTVYNTFVSKDIFHTHMWLYYPDPRAYHIEIYNNSGDRCIGFDLKEHPRLNGSYYFSYMPDGSEVFIPTTTTTPITPTEPTPEVLNNFVLQSDVDNPFTFRASGYTRVGQGEIIGLAGLTTALSQDAYKVATTLAFTTQGIWAMQIDGEGKYANVPPPFSREVCKSRESITMTDGAVFFVSEKGLMCVTDTKESGVICVSEQLNGIGFVNFYKYLEDCMIAHDYRDSLLYVMNPNYDFFWVLNMKTRTWSTVEANVMCGQVLSVVNDYPDTIIQIDDYSCYSVLGKKIRDNDDGSYDVSFESRALKLDGSLVLKSLRRVKVLGLVDKSKVEVSVFGSNDLSAEDVWRDITSTRGKSYRFFKVMVNVIGMTANETISGVVLETQKRFVNKIR